LFGRKIFSFCIFQKIFYVFFGVWCNRKWWSTEIIFSLTEKAYLIFGKWFTVFQTVNYILNLNFSLLHARLWESAATSHWSLLVTWICLRRFSDFEIRLSESGDTRRILETVPYSRDNYRILATIPDSNNCRQNPVASGRIPATIVGISLPVVSRHR
jgi:hypothetical protein